MLFVILVPVYGQESAYPPSWNSLQNHEIPAWFKDAKFGIYTHWGVYSVPAKGPNGTWYPHTMYCKGTEQYNYHVEHYGLPSQFGYKDFIPMFKADKFNAGGQVSIVSPKRQTVGILHIYPESSECRDAEQELY